MRDEFRVRSDQAVDGRRIREPADGVRHVESEEVVGVEVDVVGVHVARLRPI